MLVAKFTEQAADQFHGYDALLILGVLSELLCTGCLVLSRTYRRLPILTSYLAFMSVADTLGAILYFHGTTRDYWPIFLGISCIEYCFQLAVMWELFYILCKPVQSLSSVRWLVRGALLSTVTFLIAAAVSATMVVYHLVSNDAAAFFRLNLGFSIFRALVLLSILHLALILGVRARSHVAHVASYLSFYSVASLLCQIARQYPGTHKDLYNYYETIEVVRIACWCVLVILIGGSVMAQKQHAVAGVAQC